MSEETRQFGELVREAFHRHPRSFEIYCERCKRMRLHTVTIKNGKEHYTCQACGKPQECEEPR